ncbi:hypothetical protein ABZ814_06380 [Micromonospora musae]|uniref:hypothetical protein n=1 Tax=Micromonospora musae TaxID=1894970 RepID=UPI0033CC793A
MASVDHRVHRSAMDANTITAVCATGIAVASLAVSITEARASRHHNRQSVRPVLQFELVWQPGGDTGVRLSNHGLGPAVVTRTAVTLDGEPLGAWEEGAVNRINAVLPTRPRVLTLRDQRVLPVGFHDFLFHLPNYQPDSDHWFWHLLRHRLQIEVWYESLYGRDPRQIRSLRHRDGPIPPRPGSESEPGSGGATSVP